MSIIDRAISYVSHWFDSPPAQPQPIPVTRINLPAYGTAPARLAPTTPRGSERLFQNPTPVSSRPASTSDTGLGATLLGATLLVGGALLSESGIGIGMMVAGFGILGIGCGGTEEDLNNFNANVPEASAPVTQDQWCEGVRSLTAAPITDASPLINRFPGISEDLRNLPSGMSAIGIAPQEASAENRYAYVLIQNRRAPAEREATEQASYVLLYERNAEGRYMPSQVRDNDPLGVLRNVAHFDSIDADSITYVRAEAFRQNTQADGAARVNLSHPTLTNNNSILIRYSNGQITIIPYGQTRPAGGADACAFYGQSRNPNASDAGVGMDATLRDSQVPANDARADARVQDAMGMDAGTREAGADATAADVRSDASSDAARDAGADRPDARRDATSTDARGDVMDAARDGGRDGGDAARDGGVDASDAARDVPRG